MGAATSPSRSGWRWTATTSSPSRCWPGWRSCCAPRARSSGATAPTEPMAAEAPLVAICMAAFEPDPALLERQIASIREQSHEQWLCLISDDGSSPERFEHLRALTFADPRFTLLQGESRLGFYANFERALRMVPATAA